MWVVYAAAGWAFLFAAMSFYWAAGGMLGANTLGEGIEALALARDPEIIAITWVTGILKFILGLLGLALVANWGRRLPRKPLLIAAWGAGALLTLYGIALLVEHGLILAGNRAIPGLLGSMEAVRWHLFFWDPFWLAGGILFLLAARWAGKH